MLARRSLARGDERGRRQRIHRWRQQWSAEIGADQREAQPDYTMNTMCAALAIADAVLRAGVVRMTVVAGGSGRVMFSSMPTVHMHRSRCRVRGHSKSLRHRRAGQRQCQKQGKRDSRHGHEYNFSIALCALQTTVCRKPFHIKARYLFHMAWCSLYVLAEIA
jgi:hypothetical protein